MQAGSTMLRARGPAAVRAGAPARCVAVAVSRPSASPVPSTAARRAGVKVTAAAVEAAPTDEVAQAAVAGIAPQADALEAQLADLEVAELEAAAEEALGWLLSHNEEEQEKDLDEMVDYDEFGDDEYTELFPAVESMIEGSYADIRVGDRVLGTVYEVDEEGAYVELGEKASGFVPLAECSFAKLKTPLEVLRVGMQREFVVIQREDENGQMVLSLAATEATVMWHRMQQMKAEGQVVSVKVASANKGGLLVQYGPFDGFLPIGQFGMSVNLEDMESLVGQEIPVQFLDVDEEAERLVFSNRRAGGAMAAPMDIKMGDVVQGVIQMVKPYGVFVDLGGLTGLLHLSQISAQRVTAVDKIFAEGDKIKVMVLSTDKERGRITLSTKKLEANPGDMLRDPQAVYEGAEAAAALFKERMAATSLSMQAGIQYGAEGQQYAAESEQFAGAA